MNKLEIACFNYKSAIIASENGANRIEFCANINEGGTTPDFDETEKLCKEIDTKITIMIRPRGGNFVYSDEEFQIMKKQIIQFKALNISGFVFGNLTKNNEIDLIQNKELIELSKPIPCTFHRAFDLVFPLEESLETVINLGFKTILTSGKTQNVVDGLENLETLVKKAENRITIMPGGGLRSTNIELLQNKTKANFYHSSGITDSTEIANPIEIKAIKSKLIN